MLTAALQALVRHASGLHLNRPTVARAARQRMREAGIDGLGAYLARINTDAAELPALLELLVVPETWLFRDPEAFAAAAAAAASLVRQRAGQPGRPVRLLSLPCATGEEPYSLVMALLDAGLNASQFTVDALDISAAALARARTALYRQNAFRNDDLGFRDRYFTECDGGYQLDAAVRGQVRFGHGNLMTMLPTAATQRYDIVFCRNLLIYFDEATQVRAIGILDSLLDDDGMLFSGYAELPVFTANGFVTAHFPRAFALRKQKAGAVSVPAGHDFSRPRTTRAAVLAGVAVAGPPPPVANAGTFAAQATTSPASTALARSGGGCDDPAQLLAQAHLLADRGDLAAAGAQLDACLLGAPESAPAYAMRGAVHAAQGDDRQAEQCLRRALYLDPQQYEVICQLAVLAERHGDAGNARTLRARAARIRARQGASGPDDSLQPDLRERRGR